MTYTIKSFNFKNIGISADVLMASALQKKNLCVIIMTNFI